MEQKTKQRETNERNQYMKWEIEIWEIEMWVPAWKSNGQKTEELLPSIVHLNIGHVENYAIPNQNKQRANHTEVVNSVVGGRECD